MRWQRGERQGQLLLEGWRVDSGQVTRGLRGDGREEKGRGGPVEGLDSGHWTLDRFLRDRGKGGGCR